MVWNSTSLTRGRVIKAGPNILQNARGRESKRFGDQTSISHVICPICNSNRESGDGGDDGAWLEVEAAATVGDGGALPCSLPLRHTQNKGGGGNCLKAAAVGGNLIAWIVDKRTEQGMPVCLSACTLWMRQKMQRKQHPPCGAGLDWAGLFVIAGPRNKQQPRLKEQNKSNPERRDRAGNKHAINRET